MREITLATPYEKEKKEWLIAVILIVLFLTSLPYAVGLLLTPPGMKFLGLLRLKDDLAVYLSWIEQVRQGDLLFENLFTNQPQKHPFFNIFVLIVGGLCRILNVSPLKMLFALRLLFGGCLLWVLYKFSGLFLLRNDQRRTALLLLAFSSGLGWLVGGYSPEKGIENSVDLWQPESTIFFTIYTNPLFSLALILLVGVFYFYQKEESWKRGVLSGLCLLILANIHTYDILIVAVVWLIYIIFSFLSLRDKASLKSDIVACLIAFLIASPAIVHQLYLLKAEPLFAKRASVPTSSPTIIWYFSGMGLLLPLAFVGGIKAMKQKRYSPFVYRRWTKGVPDQREDAFFIRLLFLIAWAVGGFLLPYLPVSFQRKLFMGTQIPLCFLSAKGLGERFYRNSIYMFLLLLFLFPSNAFIIGNDIRSLITGNLSYLQPNYITEDEAQAMKWLRKNVGREEPILSLPEIGCYIPALAGRRVYVGHWGETPDFAKKYNLARRFYALGPDEWREEFLKENGIRYVYYGRFERLYAPHFNPLAKPYLKLVYNQGEISIWRVTLPFGR